MTVFEHFDMAVDLFELTAEGLDELARVVLDLERARFEFDNARKWAFKRLGREVSP